MQYTYVRLVHEDFEYTERQGKDLQEDDFEVLQ